jgi:hypothetical protein
MKNTGKAYEELTQQVFDRLLAQSGLCVRVERDVILPGRSTTHQIDVTFEFVAGPATYRTVVQCKDWATAVKQEQVLAFHSVLTDIPGQPRGIMVARAGFQEGARRVAEHHGIKLYELREPCDSDWDGLIRAVQIESSLLMPVFRNVAFEWDKNWARDRLAERGLRKLDLGHTIIPGRHRITFESGKVCDLPRVLAPYVPEGACDWTAIRCELAEVIEVEIPGCEIPMLRALAVTAEVQVTEHTECLEIALDHLVAYCFRDVLRGESRLLGEDCAPLEDEDTDGGES